MGHGHGPDSLVDPGALASGYRLAIRLPLFVCWSFPSPCCVDSSVRSRLPFVHGFPCSGDASRTARRRHAAFVSACVPPFCRVFRVFSSTLLPALLWPCFFGTTRESATLCPSLLRGLLVRSVCCRLWQLQRQDRRASLGKTHLLPVSRPASCRFSTPDIRPRLVTPARPLPQHHIADSLFATYTGSASCFLQTIRFRVCPCLVGVVLPSGNGGPICSRLRLERRPVRHARHT